MASEGETVKKLLLEFLHFLIFKIENDGMSLNEMEALLNMVETSVPAYATVSELASYYGKSEVAVRSVICRKMRSKPRRIVTYDFREFSHVAPDSWTR